MTILVVDDDPLALKLMCRIVSADGLEPAAAASAREALQFFDRAAADVALLVTDVLMPDMDGRELARTLRARRPDLPVLFVSGYCQTAQIDGRSAFLPKPFSPAKLQDRVRRLLNPGLTTA